MNHTQTIGLIGSGHLGKALSERIRETSDSQLLVSTDRHHNVEIAQNSDLLILTVRPSQVSQVMTEVREKMKQRAVVLSFAAATPVRCIGDGFQNTVVRAMTDIQFRQITAQSHSVTDHLLSRVSKNSLLSAKNEDEIDAFTVLVGCFPGVCAWQFVHNPHAEEWLKNYALFIQNILGVPLQVSLEILDDIRVKGNFESTLASVATQGGVTESLVNHLATDRDATFSELFTVGMRRITDIARKIESSC